MVKPTRDDQPKAVRWIGCSKEDLSGVPEKVRRRVGGALRVAQIGRKAPYAKPLKGFGDAGVMEIVDNFDGDTFRAVYTVRFAKSVYVLHAFQKKSKRGAGTPKVELDLIDLRLKRAREDYEQWSKKSEMPASR
jgi:phage-related protein